MFISKIKNFFSSTKEYDPIDVLIKLYEGVNGHSLSTGYRNDNGINDQIYTYGEAKFVELINLLKECGPDTEGKVFYDMGSGTGKPCLTAALNFNFKKVTGIEFIPSLYQASVESKNKLASLLPPSAFKIINKRLNFINNDFLQEDISDADIVFCNSTCFSQELVDGLSKKFEYLKKGACVVILTKSLKSERYKMIFESNDVEFSWGKPTTRIYRKII